MKDRTLTLIERPCAVTACDLRIKLCADGRERGLWFFLKDDSIEGAEMYKRSLAIEGDSGAGVLAFRLNSGGLLKWPEAEEFYKVIGRAIRAHKSKNKSKNKSTRRKCDVLASCGTISVPV